MKLKRSMDDFLGDAPPPKPAKRERGRPIEPHRTAKVQAETELLRIKTAKLRGELIPVADVEAEWSALVTDARQRLLAVPSRLGTKLGLSREQVAIADAEIRAALTALAGQDAAP